MKIPIHKVRQYSIKQLSLIFLYRLAYEALVLLENIKIFLFKPKYKPKLQDINQIFEIYSDLKDQMIDYYSFCYNDTTIIVEEANNILEGKLNVLGYKYNFNYNTDWLKDPISGNFWNHKSYFSNSTFNQDNCNDVKYVLELNKFNHLVKVALAFYHTNDDIYIYHIEKEILAWSKIVLPGKSVANRITMDLAFRTINLIQILLLCKSSNYFICNIHPVIMGILIKIESHIKKFHTAKWFKAGNDNNHVIGELSGLIITQILLNKFSKKGNYKQIIKEFKYLDRALKYNLSKSGVYLEQSANYSRVVAEFLIILEMFIKTSSLINGHHIIKSIEQSINSLLIYLNNISYHNTLPNFGDNDNARVLTSFIKDYNSIDYINTYFKKKKNIYDNYIKTIDYIDGSQWVFKSQDINDIYMFTRVGKFAYFKEGANIHAHNDLLSLIMFIKGLPIFIDKGCLFYNSGINIKNEQCKTSSHNTISIENKEQSKLLDIGFADYPHSNLLHYQNPFVFNGEIIYKNSSVHHKRKICYEKSIIIIEDFVKSNSKVGTINYLFSDIIKPKLIANNEVVINANNRPIAKISFDSQIETSIIKDEFYPNYGEVRITQKLIGRFNINENTTIYTKISIL